MSSPLTIRKNSSTSTTSSMEYQYILRNTSPSSPLLSSSPLRTPLHPTRRYEDKEWPACAYYDDLDRVLYDQKIDDEDAWFPRTHLGHPFPHTHQPLPSLMSKCATRKRRSDIPLSYDPSPFSSVTQTMYLCSQGDSAIADDWEEYDLESMDIHIRETYFATSAERGRWLSSPITTRVRSQAIPPARGYSSPLKKVADATPSPTRGHPCKQEGSCSAEKRVSISSADCEEEEYYSYSLPPSSPLSSPMSTFSLLGHEGEDDSVGDPHSNSDDRCSLRGTPELRPTSAPPVQPARSPHPRETPVILSTLHPTGTYPEYPGSTISPHTSRLSIVLDMDTFAPCNTDFQSKISSSETDSLAAEHLKLPLSDTVNKPTWSQDGSPSSGSSSTNPCHEFFDVSLAVGGVSSHTKTKRKRKSVEAKRAKKHNAVQQRDPSSSAKRKIESRTDTHSESANKRSKLAHRRDESEAHDPKALLRHDEVPKVEQHSRPPSCSAFERHDSETACPSDKKTRGDEDQAEPQRQISTPVTMDAEFHASLAGMLVEAFATSRATSMDSLALHGVLTRSHPHLTAQRSKKELLEDITTVLEGGRARCGMFEKVDSSCEKSRDKALENRWFYVAERDEDSERAALITALMPRQKRKETKKYKQYYYRPLDKISRWDPEDAL